MIDAMKINMAKAIRRVPMTGWQPPELIEPGLSGIHKKGGA